MMKMHLHLPKSFGLKCRKHLYRRTVILFGREK
jgi:hypothetical protein